MKQFLVRADNVKSVLRGAGLVFIISTIGAVLGYLVQMLLARWLGSTDFGTYRYALTWSTLLAGFALWGFNASGARFISQYIQQEAPQKLRGFLIGSTALVLATAVLIAALGIAFVLLFPKASESIYAGPMIIALIGVPGLALLSLQKNNLRAFRWALIAEIPPALGRPIIMLALVTLCYFTLPVLTPTIAAGAFVTTLVIVALFQAILFRRKLRAEIESAPPSFDFKEWLGVSLPMFYGRVFLLASRRADLILIGLMLEPADVGIYAIAQSVTRLISLTTVSVVAYARPTIASMYLRDRRGDIQRLLNVLVNLTFWPSLAIVIGLVLFGDKVLLLFGEDFVAGYTVLIILAIGLLIHVGGGFVGVLLNMTGAQAMVARILGWTAVIKVVLTVIGIYLFGTVGAAGAAVAVVALSNIWLNVHCVRKSAFHPSILRPVYRRVLGV